ncbi:MAG: serine/threonine protein kinase, partial [Candidatus Paceibacteria bacterium]
MWVGCVSRDTSGHTITQHRHLPSPVMIKLEAGERIGSYRVIEFLARGGFALVYLAEDKEGNKVALKVGDVAGGGRYVTRFLEITNQRRPEGISP